MRSADLGPLLQEVSSDMLEPPMMERPPLSASTWEALLLTYPDMEVTLSTFSKRRQPALQFRALNWTSTR